MSDELHDNPYKIWSDEELKKAIDQMSAVLNVRQAAHDQSESKLKKINGIGVDDFVAVVAPMEYGEDEFFFSFYILRKNKLYSIYYESGTQNNQQDFQFHPWWPHDYDPTEDDFGPDRYEHNRAFDFIPPGFSEACENCYEFGKGKEAGIQRLKEYGFTKVVEHDENCWDEKEILEKLK